MGDNHMRTGSQCVRLREQVAGLRVASRPSFGDDVQSGEHRHSLRRKVNWDPAGEKIVGDAEQFAMLSRPYRVPWELPRV